MGKINTVSLDAKLRAKAKVDYYARVDAAVQICMNTCTRGWSGHWDEAVEKAVTELKHAIKEAHTERAQQDAVDQFIKDHERFADQIASLEVVAHEH
jgi:hypothetical protein